MELRSMLEEQMDSGERPAWFGRALGVPFTDEFVEVDGASIHYLLWGAPGRQGVVFVHGVGAHAHWWTHVAALLAREFTVVAIDLSGHGDSDRRPIYTLEQWAAEVIAVALASEVRGEPFIVGHSMGGFVTVAAAALHRREVGGIILCDSPIDHPEPMTEAARLGEGLGGATLYETVDDGVRRFRPVPPQTRNLDFVVDHVARRSLRPTSAGWEWKFDRHLFQKNPGLSRAVALPYLPHVSCRVALLQAEHGLLTDEMVGLVMRGLGRAVPVIEIAEAAHHAILDQPLLVLTIVRTLLADWGASADRPTPR
jgi:pimeloyl-ACP methyl ester carboxylesterase